MKLDDAIELKSGKVLKNRCALAPLTNTQSNSDGTLHDDELNWLRRRTGFGLLSTCAAYVSEEGKAWDGQLGIAEDKHLPGLARLARELSGTTSIVQLHHAGAKASLAPQRISADASDGVRRASTEDIERVVNDFTQAAVRAESAGFGGVEIHGANGYLFTQFLAPEDNHRTDEFGGSLENRARFLRRTLQSVRKEVAPDFIVNVRISPVDLYARRGLTLSDAKQLCRWLAEDGADVIHLSLRDASGPAPFEEDKTPVVTAIRGVVPPDVKIEVAGGIWDKESADRALETGADIVAVGKAGIIHPDWAEDVLNPSFEPVLPPWDPSRLREVAVGERFVSYLMKFPGLLIGGAPPRA